MPNPIYNGHDNGMSYHTILRTFVFLVLSLLLGMHIYVYLIENPLSVEGDFSDIKYVLTQITRRLTEVNRKHELFQTELARIANLLPQISSQSAAADKQKNIGTGPKAPFEQKIEAYRALGVLEYDRQNVDYALESAGAKVVDTGTTIDYTRSAKGPVEKTFQTFTSWAFQESFGAPLMLRPGSLPGECWAFKGTKGEATIKLIGLVYITGVSLEHIPPHIAATREISTAPRIFQILGYNALDDLHPHDYGTFEYDNAGKPIQHFGVLSLSPKPYRYVKFRVISNWGNKDYTCVYRLRIHGDLSTKKKVDFPKAEISDSDSWVDSDTE